MVMNKKGQQMTLGTIIAIVLGIAVLVFLIFGFSTGWNNMWSKITELGGGSVNVDDVVRGCEVACAQQSKNAYCDKIRTMNFGQERNVSLANTTKVEMDKVRGSCEELANNYTGLGVAKCPNLC